MAALAAAEENHGGKSTQIIADLLEVEWATFADDDQGGKHRVKKAMDEHRVVLRDWKKTITAVEKQMNKMLKAPVKAEKARDKSADDLSSRAGLFLHSCTLVGKQELNCSTASKGDLNQVAKVTCSANHIKSLNEFNFVKGALKLCWKHLDDSKNNQYATSLIQNPKLAASAMKAL